MSPACLGRTGVAKSSLSPSPEPADGLFRTAARRTEHCTQLQHCIYTMSNKRTYQALCVVPLRHAAQYCFRECLGGGELSFFFQSILPYPVAIAGRSSPVASSPTLFVCFSGISGQGSSVKINNLKSSQSPLILTLVIRRPDGGRNRWIHRAKIPGVEIGEGFLVKLPCRAITAPLAGFQGFLPGFCKLPGDHQPPKWLLVHACIAASGVSLAPATLSSLISPAGAAVPDPELVFPSFLVSRCRRLPSLCCCLHTRSFPPEHHQARRPSHYRLTESFTTLQCFSPSC